MGSYLHLQFKHGVTKKMKLQLQRKGGWVKYYTNRFGPCLEKPFTPLSSLFLLSSVSPLVDGRLVVLFPGEATSSFPLGRRENNSDARNEFFSFWAFPSVLAVPSLLSCGIRTTWYNTVTRSCAQRMRTTSR